MFPHALTRLLGAGRFRESWDVHERGLWAEKIVGLHLQSRGFHILKRRWMAPGGGDVDLIAANDDYLLFCEVKLRSDKDLAWRDVLEDRRVRSLTMAAGDYLRERGQRLVCIRFAAFAVVPGGDSAEVHAHTDYINPQSVPGWRGRLLGPEVLRELA